MLTPEQYEVTRQGGTERAFSGKYHDAKANGVYNCVCCGAPLFRSEEKFDSGTGWPSYWAPAVPENVEEREDNSLFMRRTEVDCAPLRGPPRPPLPGRSPAHRTSLLH